VGLQGRFAEAESIVKADLPPDEAAANVDYLKQMLNRKDNPRVNAGNTPMAQLNRPD
jgi:Flp pilus assembly protein TadD